MTAGSYIYRMLQEKILNAFTSKNGIIVSGVVGCGKTTLIHHCLSILKNDFEIFEYNGDDAGFRRAVLENTRYILEEVRAKTSRRALIFVDEIQKCEEVFDALKYAYDHSDISFIVSGSNPAYLRSAAKNRMQRRAEFWELQPLSLGEIFLNHGRSLTTEHLHLFERLISGDQDANQIDLKMTLSSTHEKLIDRFLVLGGLPLAYLAESQTKSLEEIRKVVERGFELMAVENNMLTETVKAELAFLHSKEFAYRNIMRRTGITKRDVINIVINSLINHGYLVQKKPIFPGEARRSYLSVFSYIDPGIVTYLSGEKDLEQARGSRIEGFVHSRLHAIVEGMVLKTTLGYFKKYTIDKNDSVKFLGGEVDFVIQQGRKFIPIEVKSASKESQIDLRNIQDFISQFRCSMGVILYGGLPYWNKEEHLLFFPYWLL